VILGVVIPRSARLFVDFTVLYPFGMVTVLFFMSLIFGIVGFVVGACVAELESLHTFPIFVATTLVSLGGGFYSVASLSAVWRYVVLAVNARTNASCKDGQLQVTRPKEDR
jgi:hypothetical protein